MKLQYSTMNIVRQTFLVAWTRHFNITNIFVDIAEPQLPPQLIHELVGVICTTNVG